MLEKSAMQMSYMETTQAPLHFLNTYHFNIISKLSRNYLCDDYGLRIFYGILAFI